MDSSTLPVEDTQGTELDAPAVDTTDTEAPAAAAPAVEPGETPDREGTGAQPAEKPDGIQKRFDELTRAKYDAQREAAYWRGKAEGHKPEAGQGQPQAAEAKPKQEAFESYEAYLEALTEWKLTERLKTERMRMEAEQKRHTAVQGFDTQAAAARKEHADFDSVVYNPNLPISETMQGVIFQSDDGAKLAYHLGKNPEEAARIARLDETGQVLALGRLSEKLDSLKTRETPAPSSAPAPISPVKPSAPAREGLHDSLSTGDWMQRREAQLRKRKR